MLGALALQWLGLIVSMPGMPAVPLGSVAAEGVTAAVCLLVLGLTLRNLDRVEVSTMPGLPEHVRRAAAQAEQPGSATPQGRERMADAAWLWAVALVAGIAGFGLARIYPQGAAEEGALAFYWVALSGAMSLVVHGTRHAVKMAAGLLALLNAGAFALQLLGPTAPSPVALVLMAAGRIAVCVILAYMWALIKTVFLSVDLGLDSLFSGRDGQWATETAIVPVDYTEPIEPGDGVGSVSRDG